MGVVAQRLELFEFNPLTSRINVGGSSAGKSFVANSEVPLSKDLNPQLIGVRLWLCLSVLRCEFM